MPKRTARRIEAAMLDAFENQLTPEVARRVLEFAKRRAAMMQVAGCDVGGDEARALAQDAIADTLTSVTRWDHEAVALGTHLRGVIRRRTSHRMAWHRRFPHGSVETMSDAAGPLVAASTTGPRAPTSPEPALARAELARAIVGALRERAAGDPVVSAIVAAYVDGASTRGEVLAATGLAEPDYINGRRRLDRLLATLPDELRQSARDTLGRAR